MSGPESRTPVEAITPVNNTETVVERLKDEELGGLLSAIGNHEAKAITLGLMAPETTYGFSEASKVINSAQKPIGWKPSFKVPFHYMQYSLAPIGLVAKEVTTGMNLDTFGFIKTEKGLLQGDPLSGLLLDFSLRYDDVSLQEIFGRTSSRAKSPDQEATKTRAPIVRLKILRAIVSSQLTKIRSTDIAEETGVAVGNVGNHLLELSSAGIIGYSSTEPIGSFSFFRLSPDRSNAYPQIIGHQPAIDFIWKIVSGFLPDKKWTSEEIGKLYFESAKKPSANAARHRMQDVLSMLAKLGYLVKEGADVKSQSAITLTDVKRDMLIDLLTVIDGFQNQDPEAMSNGTIRLKEILFDPKLVSKLMRKAKEHSPMANSVPSKESMAQIETIVSEHPGITTKEIARVLSLSRNRRTSTFNTLNLLRALEKPGKLKSYLDGPRKRYSISELATH